MTEKEKALARIQSWNQGNFQQSQAPVWGAVQAPTYNQKQKTTGRGGPLSAFISELGGAGGAAGGAALGASIGSIVPGAGTLIGGLLGGAIGGFTGGFGGKALEQKIRDDQNLFGKGGSAKSAFGEGALSGAFGGVGAAGTGIRGLAQLGKASGAKLGTRAIAGAKELNALGKVAPNTAKQAANLVVTGGKKGAQNYLGQTGGKLASSASRLESRSLGFAQGEKVAGQQVKPNEVKSFFDTMKAEGIKTGHPDNVGKQVSDKLSKVGTQIDDVLTNSNRALTKNESDFVTRGFANEMRDNIAVASNQTARKYADSLYQQMRSINSLDDLVKQRRNIQNAINMARNNQSATPGSEEVLWSAQTWLNKLAGSMSPELKTLNKRFAGLSKLEDATLNASKSLNSQARNQGAGMMGAIRAGDTATAAKAGIGSMGRNLSEALGSRGAQIGTSVAGGAIARGIGNMSMAQPQESQDVLGIQGMTGQDMTGGLGTMQGMGDMGGQTQPQSMYSMDAALYDIQRDPQNAAEYMKLYEFVNSQSGAASGDNVGVVSSQSYGNAQSGYTALQELSSLLQSDPNVLERTRVPGRGIDVLGIGGTIANAAGTGEYDALAYNIADKYLRLTTGAQANESEVRNVMSKIMPRAGDSQSTVQTKLNNLANFFGTTLQQAGTMNSQQGNPDLASLIAQGGY